MYGCVQFRCSMAVSSLDVLQKKIVLTDLLGLIAGQHSKSSRSLRQDHITEAGWCRSTNIPKRIRVRDLILITHWCGVITGLYGSYKMWFCGTFNIKIKVQNNWF